MKHSILIFIIAAIPLLLVSCQEKDWYNAEEETVSATISDDQLMLEGKSEQTTIFMESNIWWKAHVEYETGTTEPWCEISPSEGFGNVELDVTCQRNYNPAASRTAKIVVEGNDENSSFRKEFTITQAASSPYIEVKDLTGENTLDVPIVKSTNVLEVLSNNDWTVSSDQTWCEVTGTGTSGTGTLTVECPINTSEAKRSAKVTIVSQNDPSLKYEFTVSQDDVFGATVITVTKTPQEFKASWEPVVGADHYEIIVKNAEGEIVGTIDADKATEMDLAAAPLFATPEYAGYVSLSVKTMSEDPAVFSISEEVVSNSHFTSGKGTASDPFIIGDQPSFDNISKANKVLAGACYRLDILPSLDNFTPVCSPNDPFGGVFDGNGKTISGWKSEVESDKLNCFGFFGAIASGAKVSGLSFKNCTISIKKGEGSASDANNGFGFVAGINNGEVNGIDIEGCTIETEIGASPVYAGGVTGQNGGKVVSCKVFGGLISAAPDRNKADEFNCGGITGYNMAGATVKDCMNANEIKAMNNVGGIAGYNDGHIERCCNKGKITANYYFGGIAGYVKTTGKNTSQIKDCYNTGTLVMDEPEGYGRGAAYMGGIISRIHCTTSHAIINCYNSGEMIVGPSVSSSNMRIGGLVGHVNNTGTLENSYFCGKVTIKGKVNYGGIVGEFAKKATKIINCYSTGQVVKEDGASGNIYDAFGSAASGIVVTSCYALSNGGSDFAGGDKSGIGAECGNKTEAELKNQATYSGWDFTSVWKMGASGYPELRSIDF